MSKSLAGWGGKAAPAALAFGRERGGEEEKQRHEGKQGFLLGYEQPGLTPHTGLIPSSSGWAQEKLHVAFAHVHPFIPPSLWWSFRNI